MDQEIVTQAQACEVEDLKEKLQVAMATLEACLDRDVRAVIALEMGMPDQAKRILLE